ncbi:MAG: hypothetical protein ACKO37_03775 [Vampirovibrionales bacterium]
MTHHDVPFQGAYRQGLAGREMPMVQPHTQRHPSAYTSTSDEATSWCSVPDVLTPHHLGYAGCIQTMSASQQARVKYRVYHTPVTSWQGWVNRHIGDVLMGARDVMLGHVLALGGLGLFAVLLISYVPVLDWLKLLNTLQKSGFGWYQWLFIACFLYPVWRGKRHHAYGAGVLLMGVLLSILSLWIGWMS